MSVPFVAKQLLTASAGLFPAMRREDFLDDDRLAAAPAELLVTPEARFSKIQRKDQRMSLWSW